LKKLRQLLRERRQQALGIHEAGDDQAEKPIQEHIDAWIKVVEARGGTAKHHQQRRQAVEELARLAG
jgi:nitrogen fixation protein FixH